MELSTLTSNQVGRVRSAKLGGREYLVAPLSMLVPGVLPGSKGPLYYPPDVVNRNPSAWNSIPIVVNHPFNANGPTSARDPDILNQQGIGFVFKARANGKAEGWFDVENTKRIEPRIYKSLITNTPIELSTGLFTKHKKASGNYKGKTFEGVITNLEPDHLAVLMDQTGACSLKDGCGVLINKEHKPMPTLLERLANLFVTNKEQEVEEEEELVENQFIIDEDEIVSLVQNGWVTTKTGVHIFIGANGQITKGPKGLKGKSIPGGGSSAKGKSENKEEFGPSSGALKSGDKVKIHSPSNKDIHGATGVVSEKGLSNAPNGLGSVVKTQVTTKSGHSVEYDALRHEIHTAAKGGETTKLANKELSKLSITGASKALDKQGYKLGKSEVKLVEGKFQTSYDVTDAAGKTSKMSPNQIKDIVRKGMTQNSEGSQFGKPHITKGEPNMAKQKKIVVNEEIELDEDEREELVESIVGNCNCHEDDTLVLHSLSDETLAKLAAMGLTNNASSMEQVPSKKGTPKKKMVMTQEEHDAMMAQEEEEEGEPVTNAKSCAGKGKGGKKLVNNSNAEPKLTPKQQMLINYAEEKMQEERSELVEKLLVNAEEDDVEELTETYNSLSIPQLKLMVKALPKEKEEQVQQPVMNHRQLDARQHVQQQRNFAGAAGAVIPSNQQRRALTNNGKAEAPDFDDAPLEQPTINYEEVAGFKNGRFQHADTN